MSRLFDLSEKRFLVTGASSGIGRAICREIAALGGAVVATGRNEKRLEETLESLGEGDHVAVSADLTEGAERARLVEAAASLHGVVHAAGQLKILPFAFTTEKALREIQEINFEAPAFLVRDLLKAKKIANGGSIVFVTSVAGRRGAKGHALYGAGKAALTAAARSLALELGGRRIRVNCIAPGMVRTAVAESAEEALSSEAMRIHEQEYALGFGAPEDVAGAAAFLLVDASRWITGTTVVVDGGFSAR